MRRRDFLGDVAGSIVVTAGSVQGITETTDQTDTAPYRPLGRLSLRNAREAVVGDDGTTAFVAVTDGIAVVDVTDPSDPTLLAEERGLLADREDGPMEEVWDVSVDGDRLVLAGPAVQMNGDVLEGFLLYDVSDPEALEPLAFHETEFSIHNAFLRSDRVYLTGTDRDREPLVVVDVTDDRPVERGRWSLIDHDPEWETVDARLRRLHDVWVRDDVAYLAYWDAGTWLVDVRDPADPAYVGDVGGRSIDELASVPSENVGQEGLELPGNHHFAMTNEAGTLLGVNKEAWALDPGDTEAAPGGVELWDVSDPATPKQLTTIEPPSTPDPTRQGASAASVGMDLFHTSAAEHATCHRCGPTDGAVWTTSHNFDLVGDRLFTSWYQGGVKIHDISDPTNPHRLAWWRQPDEAAFWTARRATDSTFVASSYGRPGDDKGALYTFPNESGEQEDPPSLVPRNTTV